MDLRSPNRSEAKPLAAAKPPHHQCTAGDECSSFYRSMQECVFRTNRNWRECQTEVQALRECLGENRRRNKGR